MEEWAILEDELIQYRDISISIGRILCGYEGKCEVLIGKIKCVSFFDSQEYFDNLYDIQNKIATALYKYGFNLSKKQRDFVYSFERDDIYTRRFWFEKFKSGDAWPNEK